jgi:putative oxidoreductase
MDKLLRLFFPPFPDARPSIGLLILRLVLGVGIALHGYGKIGKLEGLAAFAGVPVPIAGLAMLTELIGGILIVAGALTPLVALMLTGNMAVAALTHIRHGDPFLLGSTRIADQGYYTVGWEFATLYLVGFFVLMMAGAGVYSVDRLLFGKRLAAS